jgi:transcriptional regulator with XRE-family HTH domain
MPAAVDDMVLCILRAFGWSEARLGEELNVTQPTVNRWLSGTNPNSDHLPRIQKLYEKAKLRLSEASLMHTQFRYVCSFAPGYPQDLAAGAYEALRVALLAGGAPFLRSPGPGIALDFHVRAAELPKDVLAHTFKDECDPSRIFIVLVNARLTEEQQHRVAWDEAIAHVMSDLAKRASPKPPRSILDTRH